MLDYLFPCGILLLTVFISFLLTCWFFHATYIKNLNRRVRYLEYLVMPPRRNTEDVVPVRSNTPPPTRNRYITVDRTPRYMEEEEE